MPHHATMQEQPRHHDWVTNTHDDTPTGSVRTAMRAEQGDTVRAAIGAGSVAAATVGAVGVVVSAIDRDLISFGLALAVLVLAVVLAVIVARRGKPSVHG